jgi:hypothetical protein
MRWVVSSLLLAICADAGCITFPAGKEQPKPPAPSAAVERPPVEHPPVKPDQVSDSNAREKASQLAEELEAEGKQ